MRKKKAEKREIPIKFADDSKETTAEEAGEQPQQSDQASQGINDEQASAQSDAAHEDRPDPDELSETWDAAWAGLQAQVDSLTQEKIALYDQLLRRQAEFENYRRRVEREKSETYHRARAEVLLELLPVLDNYERALWSLERNRGDAEGLRHGIELIHRQFKDALTKFGLEPVEAVGQTFDPNLHEAVTIEPTQEHEENTVIEEFQRGYKLGDKLLRPAKVKVASSPER